ncbi:outer membrane lipoprotein-sorting protein [Paenibacillus mucilaginosus]|uniref:outer membrane lipoprotein-sorting protein n=1 Tax=Paenibacillus mucilaginosus TaxID=61624 RepID=UPI001EF02C27|nr:outer membrane lipoprotein-sorting protein [Paenibacillus mucilaginosus]MCG7217116.1 outer membrane lipoprotein carrier protein LolA [Paenibacillus mucilaginosus]WDM28250.1 outer membrane lipoprotein carrier protein LolA [Paenibacillus mucilaginosus]
MRRYTWVVALVMLCMALVVTGCGKKDAGSIVKDLDKVVGSMKSYHAKGVMKLNTSAEAQEYEVEVCFQAESYYRISLTNAKKDITQIVLRNDDGVFVLTPHLNKSFRFQSDWPNNQGQVYLYQSLVESIVNDTDRQFAEDEKAYVFDVAANYQNSSLVRQKIWLDKKTYQPQHVEVSDASANVMVELNFSEFQFDAKFDKAQFDMQHNMTGWQMKTLPTMKHEEAGKEKAGEAAGSTSAAGGTSANGVTGTAGATGATGGSNAAGKGAEGAAASGTAAAGTSGAAAGSTAAEGAHGAAGAADTHGTAAAGAGTAGQAAAGAAGQGTAPAATGTAGPAADTGAGSSAAGSTAKQTASFGVIEPHYLPSGVKRQDMTEVKLGEDKAVMLRYSGKYNFTLLESRPTTKEVSYLPGDVLDLGFTLGVVTGDAKKTLVWTSEGVEFRLSTADLPQDEMIKVAQAVQGELGK